MAGLLILPGRLLGPDSAGQDAIPLPAAAASTPVEAAPVAPAHHIVRRHAPAKAAVTQAAAFHAVPVVNRIVPAATPVAKVVHHVTKAAAAAAGRPSARRTRHEIAPDPPAAVATPTVRPPPDPPATAPAPTAAPAATPTAAAAVPPAATTPTPATVIPLVAGVIQTTAPSSSNDDQHDNGHGHDDHNGHNDGSGTGHGHGHGK
ncbi:MAG TPA: hypothetical protein VHV52_03955 [Gaiellaceae bacterium]|nr:hypothetical protein [Gaiellaceae bacterium]